MTSLLRVHSGARRVLRAAGPATIPGGGGPENFGVTPANLIVPVGPLEARPASVTYTQTTQLDARYDGTEFKRFWGPNTLPGEEHFIEFENDPQGRWINAAHYGGLMSRIQRDLRDGNVIGLAATDDTISAYARGRRITKRFIAGNKAAGWNLGNQWMTGMDDIECLWVLEAFADARSTLWARACMLTNPAFGYLQFNNPKTDSRLPYLAIQSASFCHRHNIPYQQMPGAPGGFDPSPGSWLASGTRQIGWIFDQVAKFGNTGSIPSPVHADGDVNGTANAYLFNCGIIVQLLRWWAFIDRQQSYFDLARLCYDWLIEEFETRWQPLGWECPPYVSEGPSSLVQAPDLAGYYVYPGCIFYKETGDAKYKTFALNMLHATRLNSFGRRKLKQWNQEFSVHTQNTEALLNGFDWRPA